MPTDLAERLARYECVPAPITVEPFVDERDTEQWETLVGASRNGTFMHTRRFIDYHGSRFEDCSLVVRDARGAVRAIVPAAWDPGDRSVVPVIGLCGTRSYVCGLAVQLFRVRAASQLHFDNGCRGRRQAVILRAQFLGQF